MKVMKMIRLIQRRLIIPRGDTGSFSIPVLSKGGTNNIAVFTIFDETTRTKMFQKIISGEGDVLTIAFTHSDTVNLKPGKYVWDIKYYKNPEYIDDELVNGEEINSYYAGFSLPVCEIRETADNYLVSPEAPTATLSPEQLEIVTGAIHSLNEAIRKTQENVEHYPEIRDEVWYAWDAELGDYVNTGVRANGIVGNGIASAVLNDDYTLTLNFTDGTSFTSTSIRGETGNGIDDIVLNNDFTLTISYTDGESYTTPSIRGPIGATPQFSIGTVQDGAVAAASITGTAENPVLNLTLPNANVPTRVSQLENDANYAADANYVHTDNNYTTAEKEKLSDIAAGAEVNVNADWNATSGDAQILNKPTKVSDFTNDAGYLTTETDPTVPAWAKAAQKPSYTAAEVGATTEQEVSGMIAEAIGQINSFDMAIVQTLPTQDISTHTIYLVPKTGETNDVYDEYIYINDAWEMVGNTQIDLSNYVQKTDYATANSAGVVKIGGGIGTGVDGSISVIPATKQNIKDGQAQTFISSNRAHTSTFYGLAKAAGDTTQSQSDNSVGQYTDEAKAAIQQMLNVPSATDTILNTTLSIGRKSGTTVGSNSVALGVSVESSGKTSYAEGSFTVASNIAAHAEGYYTVASGSCSHAENGGGPGVITTASGQSSHAEGRGTLAAGTGSHSEGVKTQANGNFSHAEGSGTIANASTSHVFGAYNIADIHDNWSEWVASTEYSVGDKVKVTTTIDNETTITGYVCKTANSDAEFTVANWTKDTKMNYVEIVGNGTSNARSNAYTLDWDGNGHYAGDVYVHANADSTGGTKLATVNDIPEVPVQDVQVNGVSVLSDGVANVPIASSTQLGVVKVNPVNGVQLSSTNTLITVKPSDSEIKGASDNYKVITTYIQHKSTFYGLAKAAGSDEKNSTLPVGQYTESAKSAISEMLNGSVSVSGTTPTINALPGIRYICGEVTTIDIVTPASGIIDVVFTSGSTLAVLTVTPPSGMTMKWANGFDPDNLEADTTYEINIADGCLGVAGTWS